MNISLAHEHSAQARRVSTIQLSAQPLPVNPAQRKLEKASDNASFACRRELCVTRTAAPAQQWHAEPKPPCAAPYILSPWSTAKRLGASHPRLSKEENARVL